MTIGKGSGWGVPTTAIPQRSVGTDAELHQIVNGPMAAAVLAGEPVEAIALTGGSFWKMVGGAAVPGRATSPDSVTFPCDVLSISWDGGHVLGVASTVARNPRWTSVFVAMNTQDLSVRFFGGLRLGHRAHPGDGLVDVYDADLRVSDLRKVAQRARLGAHLPHPRIRESRVASCERTFQRPRRLRVDGISIGRTRNISISVLADRLRLVV